MPTTYLVALDDSGQKGIRLPTSQSFALGGIVLPARRLAGLQSDWRAVMELEQGKEAKVPELLAKFGDIVGGEPNFNGRAVLSVLLRQWGALPVFVHAKKAETTMTLTTRRGGLAIDLKGLYYTLALQIANFLRKSRGKARVVTDRLANTAEESVVQSTWRSTLERLGESERLGDLEFCDSRSHPAIQVAGVLMGLLRQSSEANEVLSDGMSSLLREAHARHLPSFHV